MLLPRKTIVAREWVIFSLSVGLGGHLALAFLLHNSTPDLWQGIGWKAVLFGLFVYVAVQSGRSIFCAIRSRRAKHDT